MLKHEVRLVDPEHDTIVTALTQTTVAANKRCRSRLLEDAPLKWKKFAKAVAGAPEGYEMFRGGRGGVPATQVLAAWWTDAIGRKHVVMRGRRVEHDEAKRLLQKDELDKRPPLFHAYPEYVYRRTMNGAEQIVCACGCGAVGSPEALSWMGPMCGPCFDRKEELGPDGLRANVPGVLHGDREPLGAVVCSPDGRRVAAKEGVTRVTYWDIPGRARTTMEFTGRPITALAFTSDARHLLVAGVGLVPGIGLYATINLSTDPPERQESVLEYDPPGWGLNALPDSELALACRAPAGGSNRAEVIRVNGEAVRVANLPSGGTGGPFALSPDGTKFVTCGPRPAVMDLDTLRPVARLAGSGADVVAFSHDGSQVFAHQRNNLVIHDTSTGEEVLRVSSAVGKAVSHSSSLVADPSGTFLYIGGYTGRLFVLAVDTLKLRAVFDWHLGAITGLAVSADGSRLFSAGGDGCVKVWLIRDLLRDV